MCLISVFILSTLAVGSESNSAEEFPRLVLLSCPMAFFNSISWKTLIAFLKLCLVLLFASDKLSQDGVLADGWRWESCGGRVAGPHRPGWIWRGRLLPRSPRPLSQASLLVLAQLPANVAAQADASACRADQLLTGEPHLGEHQGAPQTQRSSQNDPQRS